MFEMTYPKSCCCLSLRTVAVIIGLGGTAIGLVYIVHLLYVAILYVEGMADSKSHSFIMVSLYEFLESLTFIYLDAMRVIFSLYLIYGAFKNYPMKTCYIFAWVVYQSVTAFTNFLNIVFLFVGGVSWIVLVEDFILAVFNIGSLYLVYSYYHNLPKKISATHNSEL